MSYVDTTVYTIGGPHNKNNAQNMHLNRKVLSAISNVLAAIYDSTAIQAKFRSTFDGNCDDTIRFIFDMKRHKEISNFQQPHTLFTQIYNALSTTVQARLSTYRESVIKQQVRDAEEDAEDAEDGAKPTEEQYAVARTFRYESIEEFFISQYLPQITKGKIIGQIKRIKMRYNENPMIVLEQVKSAIAYAKKTVDLIETVGALSDDDIKHVLLHIFVYTNNIEGDNDGGVNRLMQKTVQRQQWDHNMVDWIKGTSDLVRQIQSEYYAKNEKFRIKFYPPIQLPLWEGTSSSTTPARRTPPNTAPRRQRKRKYQFQDDHDHNNPTPYNPKSYRTRNKKRQRISNESRGNGQKRIQCWRCGKPDHHAMECRSKWGMNGEPLGPKDKRKPNEMDYKVANRWNQGRNNRGNDSSQKRRPWKQFPSQQPNNHNNPQPSTNNNPEITALVAEMYSKASQDVHFDPDMLKSLQSIKDKLGNQPRQ